jgi:hypothetical protein
MDALLELAACALSERERQGPAGQDEVLRDDISDPFGSFERDEGLVSPRSSSPPPSNSPPEAPRSSGRKRGRGAGESRGEPRPEGTPSKKVLSARFRLSLWSLN